MKAKVEKLQKQQRFLVRTQGVHKGGKSQPKKLVPYQGLVAGVLCTVW
jgi:hypothetical protein